MASPARSYQEEMHKNLGYFATWLPGDSIQVGDVGILDGGRFHRHGSLAELGLPDAELREGASENLSYSAAAKRSIGASAGAAAAVPVAQAELSIAFSRAGGYVFEAIGIRNFEVANRMALAEKILSLYEGGKWRKEWFLVDSIYAARAATILVSEEDSGEIVLKASGNVPVGPLPLADPKLGLTVTSSSGRIVHVVARHDLTPLYSLLKVRDPLFGNTSLSPVRGMEPDAALRRLSRPSLMDLLES